MVKEVTIEGYNALQKTLEGFQKADTVYILFTGSPGPDGKSWCPDCIDAEPGITAGMAYISQDATFIHCRVGDRPYWKDETNPFRTKMGIHCVPTIIKWGDVKRLEEGQCGNIQLLQMLFEDD